MGGVRRTRSRRKQEAAKSRGKTKRKRENMTKLRRTKRGVRKGESKEQIYH